MKSFSMSDVVSHGDLNVFLQTNMHIEWSFVNMCNYHCSYCTGYGHFDREQLSSRKDIFFALDNIFSLKRASYSFNFLGGEPTLHRALVPCLSAIHSSGEKVSTSIVSNGSQSLLFFDEYSSVVANKNHHLMLSFHVEKASFNHFKEIIKLLSNKKIFISVFFMNSYGNGCDVIERNRERNFEIIAKFLDLRKDFFFNFSINNILELPNLDKFCTYYQESDFYHIENFNKMFTKIGNDSQVLKPSSFEVYDNALYKLKSGEVFSAKEMPYEFMVNNKLRDFKHFYCLNGFSEVFINEDGACFGAKCNSKKYICNIFTEKLNYQTLFNIVKCCDSACTCPSNDSLPKFCDETSAQIFLEDTLTTIKNEEIINDDSGSLFKYDYHEVQKMVDKLIFYDDHMKSNLDEYLSIGKSALHVITTFLHLAYASKPQKILDFGSGAGRVTRWLCAAFPHAQITACDVRENDLEFLRETFRVKTLVASDTFDFLNFDEKYNCIWVGSVFTHLSVSQTFELFLKLFYMLEIGGVIVATFHGRRAIEFMHSGILKYIDDSSWPAIVGDYNKTGYGYADYPEMVNWGVSLTKASWFVRFVESKDNMRLVGIVEKGWADHHDVLGVQRVK